MTPVEAIQTCLRKYATFSGRSVRSEFWWFAATCVLVLLLLEIIQGSVWGWTLKNGSVSNILTAGFIFLIALPVLAALVRRMQDIGFHPIVALVPGLILYGLVPLMYDIVYAQKTASGLVGSDARRASFDTVFGQMGLYIGTWPSVWVPIYYLALTTLPTDFARRRAPEISN